MEKLLRSKNIRVTDFRLAVLEVFNRYDNAVSHEQIENDLKEFDRITLYRTLKTFREKGVIHEIILPGEIKKMALCNEECGEDDHQHHHEHIHFLCNSCSEIYCVEIQNLPKIALEGFKIESFEIQATGLCNNCL